MLPVRMSKLILLVLGIVILMLPVALVACGQDTVLVHVHVLTDHPPLDSEYELREGDPNSVDIYKFYLETPGLPGSGTFKKLDSIPLNKVGNTEFYGEKLVKKIDGILCIGYPSTNLIDGQACVEIDQSQDEVAITVYYWKTKQGIL